MQNFRKYLSDNNSTFEIINDEHGIIQVESHSRLNKIPFNKMVNNFKKLNIFEINKCHKKDLSGLNSYIIRIKKGK